MNRRHFIAAAALAGTSLALRAENERKLRVAVIGHTGRGDYGHSLDTMWFAIPETEIVAVADPDAAGLAKAQARLKLSNGYSDYRKMLAETKPDIVAVCTRHVAGHRDMIFAACEAGARGIYVEKPLCPTPAEADEIVAACDRHGVRLAVAHRNRYHPAINAVAQLVKDGKIGRLLEIRARGKEDARAGVQDLWILGGHVFNLMVFFAGEPRVCSATLLQDGRPITKADLTEGKEGIGYVAGNELHARFELASGISAFYDCLKEADAGNYGLQLVGSKGVVSMRIDAHPIAHFIAGPPLLPREKSEWIPVSSAGPGIAEPIENLGKLVGSHVIGGRDLIAAMKEKREPLCSARDARLTIEMTCAVLESAKQAGARVTFPLANRANPLVAW